MKKPGSREVKTRTVTYAGRTVALPDLPRYAKFYTKLASGTWEPRTFAILGRNLTPATTYLDIGAWIGVTPFWAAGLAGKVIAVEPDPASREILRALAPAHPNLTLLEGALSPDAQVTINAVDGFGSSESSLLAIGTGARDSARGWRMTEILALAGPGPVFAKIDIEGYEYLVPTELAGLLTADLTGLQLAVHPDLYARTLTGPAALRRLRAALATRRLARLFTPRFGAPKIHKHGSLLSYLLFGVLLRVKPRGTDLVFERA